MKHKKGFSGIKIPKVKICCIGSVREACLAIRYGASALGFVSHMPGGPGIISEDRIAQIAHIVPPMVSSFLLTCKQDVASIIAQQRKCGVNTIQLCDRVPLESYKELREAMPGIALVQVVHVTGAEAIEQALLVAPHVHGILLDSGNPDLPVKELGGTGRIHDWRISRRIRESVDVPVFLGGGLDSENVAEAIQQVKPLGVDVCSGVRTEGRLDERKLAEFFEQVGWR